MNKADQKQQLLIGKSIGRRASVNVQDPNNASFLADGEIVVLDENDSPLVAGTTYAQSKYIKIVQRSGATASSAQVVQSDRIDGANVISFKGLSYAAPQEQLSYIGYDGSAGSIDASQTTDYVLRLSMLHDKDVWSNRLKTFILRYSPTSTTDQTDIVDYFASLLSDNSDVSSEVSVERLSDNAGVAEVPTLLVTKGSKTATLSATSATIVAGIYLRIGGTAVTDPVYKVSAISGTTITLDQKYQGASAAASVLESITAALANASNMGLKFTGLAQTFEVLKFKYIKVKFQFQLSGFGVTTVSYTQESKPGSGTYEQVSELEQINIGFEGAVDRVGASAPSGRSDAVAGNYDIISLEYFNNYDTLPVSGARPARASLLLSVIDGAAQTTNILAQLNSWLISVPGSFPNVSV